MKFGAFSIAAAYLSGIQNTTAGIFLWNTEWEVDHAILHSIFPHWGLPEIDLFATAKTRKCSVLLQSQIGSSFSWRHLSLLLEHRSPLCLSFSSSNVEGHAQDKSEQWLFSEFPQAKTNIVPILYSVSDLPANHSLAPSSRPFSGCWTDPSPQHSGSSTQGLAP